MKGDLDIPIRVFFDFFAEELVALVRNRASPGLGKGPFILGPSRGNSGNNADHQQSQYDALKKIMHSLRLLDFSFGSNAGESEPPARENSIWIPSPGVLPGELFQAFCDNSHKTSVPFSYDLSCSVAGK